MATVTKRRNRYVLDYYDNKGERVRKTLPEGTTLKTAKTELREIEAKLEKGNYIPGKNIPLFKKLAQDWIDSKKPNLRHSTWSVYKGHTQNHFSDLDDIRVDKITVTEVEKFIRDRQAEGMHILTLRKILVTLGQIMAYAVRHRYIDSNPVRDAERPKSQGDEQDEKISVLNPVEIKSFLGAVLDQKYKTFFKLAIMTGCRQGELIGLKWSDIDWKNSQVAINRTFNNGRWYDVKTKTSKRCIDLGPSMIKDLKVWKLACPPNKMNLIFPNEAGGPMNHSNMRARHFFPALKKAGIKEIRFHDLRHSKVSLMIDQSENLKYIQTQMGHSSPTVTLNVYAHLMKKVNPEAAKRFEDAVLNPTGHKTVTKKKKTGNGDK
ncbi:MAG: site-specific integrase [Desulfobacteraceae bacterium]|jgi:integrase|nr:MAG: site-specific integrase [Desulfobacteraceae bacterium]